MVVESSENVSNIERKRFIDEYLTIDCSERCFRLRKGNPITRSKNKNNFSFGCRLLLLLLSLLLSLLLLWLWPPVYIGLQMVLNAAGNISSKLSLGLLNFVLAVTSGWALKHYSIGKFALAAYGLCFGHSVFCILRYTHPNPGQLHRRICEHSIRYAPVVFVTLIIGQLQSISGHKMKLSGGLNWPFVVLGLYAGIVFLATARIYLADKSAAGRLAAQLERYNHGLCVLWNIFCLWQIAVVEEYWWSLGLALLVLLNHFVLWRLTLHFNISTLEVDTVGMCFSLLFAINATQELIEDSR